MDRLDSANESAMGALMVLRCACGWETTGTEDDVVAAAEEHGARVHNMRPTRDEILAMVIPTLPVGEEGPGSDA
jgi:hypothetical protein